MKLGELAERLGAELRNGDSSTEVLGVAGIEQAGPAEITFVSNPRYAPLARQTRAAAVLVEPAFAEIPAPTLRLPEPYLAFARALDLFYKPPTLPEGVHPTAIVAPSAKLGKRVSIGPYAVVSADVVLGDDSVLHPHVVLYPGVVAGARFTAHAHAVVREFCRLGDDVVLQSGVVIGGDGFGFARSAEAARRGEPAWVKIVQSGIAVLEDGVEVQSNSCIDRGSIGETRIRRGAKIDNLVQVGHGSTVGEDSLLCAQVGLAGSTTIGRNVTLAGQVGVAGHCTVGDGAIATAQSGIPNDVAPGKVVSGYPAMENRQWLRTVAALSRLPDLLRTLRKS